MAKYGGRQPEPYATYGYEAMSVLLDAMKRAGDRAAIIEQIFRTKDKKSVLGAYSIDKDGDVTTKQFGCFRVKNGKLACDETVQVEKDGMGGHWVRSGAGCRGR